MNRYFKLKKEIPGTVKLTDLVKLDQNGYVYKANRNNQSAWSLTYLDKEDLEMTEYFEESIGMSADKYVLFSGDTIYKYIENKIESCYLYSTKDFNNVYYKKENVSVVKTLPEKW